MPDTGIAGRSVLVVDDEDVFLRSLVEGLAAELPGVELFTGHNGRDALEVLEHHVVDLVVTDINMPHMDGMALVAAMVSRGIRVPVIMVTAFGTRHIELQARGHGVISVIDKPIDFSYLVEICRNTLRSLSHGNLGGVTLAGLLQLLEMERRSCTVRVFVEGHSGRILLDAGQIVGSHQGESEGMAALRQILTWPEPAIELGPLHRRDMQSKPMSLQAALLDAARLEDENQRNEWVFEDLSWAPDPPPDINNQLRDDPRVKDEHFMANVEQTISEAMSLTGCLAAALVDHENGMCLGSKANDFPIEVAAAGNTEVVRAKMRVMKDLAIEGRIEDILITLESQYHLLVPVPKGTLFLYVAIDRKKGNLAMARHKLLALGAELKV